jgi:membrane protease subunit HflK
MAETDSSPQEQREEPIPEKVHTHAHDGHTHEGCPACKPVEPLTAAEEAAIEADPAARSLARALSTSFGLLKLVMATLLVFFLLDSLTYIKQGNVGLVKRFGRYLRNPDGSYRTFAPGSLVFVWPEPVEKLDEILLKNQLLEIDATYWPEEKSQGPIDQKTGLTPKEKLAPGKDGYNLTGDLNILHTRWKVEYNVSDPVRYRLAAGNPEEVLRALVCSAVMKNMSGVSVDVLYRNTDDLFRSIGKDVNEALADAEGSRWGLKLVNITNDGLLPPGKTQSAFNAVTSAVSEKNQSVDKARAEYAKIVKEADTEADRMVKEAKGYARTVVAKTKGDAQRLQDLLEKFPDDAEGCYIYLQQYRYDQLKEMLAGTKQYLLRPGKTWFRIGSTQDEMTLDNPEEAK